ncbi:MAG: hypothetical protein ACSI46_29230 [Gloeotrichia echinulata DVL01]|nr:hypothetical protein [Gloeotrichia echinulata DEX184]
MLPHSAPSSVTHDKLWVTEVKNSAKLPKRGNNEKVRSPQAGIAFQAITKK